MKTLMLVFVSFLMAAPAMAFDQSDLDQIQTFDQLAQDSAFDFEGFSTEGVQEVEAFLGRRRVRCIAENGRGLRFSGEGRRRPQARRRAMRRCRRNSFRPRSCIILRCRRRGGRLGDLIDIIDEVEDIF